MRRHPRPVADDWQAAAKPSTKCICDTELLSSRTNLPPSQLRHCCAEQQLVFVWIPCDCMAARRVLAGSFLFFEHETSSSVEIGFRQMPTSPFFFSAHETVNKGQRSCLEPVDNCSTFRAFHFLFFFSTSRLGFVYLNCISCYNFSSCIVFQALFNLVASRLPFCYLGFPGHVFCCSNIVPCKHTLYLYKVLAAN